MDARKKNLRRNKIKQLKSNRNICLIFAISIFILSIAILSLAFKFKNTFKMDLIEKGKTEYKVYLKKDGYYKNDYMAQNLSYVSTTIDYIKVNYDYLFSLSEKSNIKNEYDIKAILTITEKDNANKVLLKEVYDQSDVILKEEKSKAYKIAEDLTIDYNKYNDYVKNYKRQYGISVDATLKVVLSAKTNSSYNLETVFNKGRELYINIPLGEQSFTIDKNEDINNLEVLSGKTNIEIEWIFLIFGLTLTIIFIIFAYMVIAKTIKYKRLKTRYELLIEKLLKEYDRNIVETTLAKINGEFANKIAVKNFSELLDVRDNTEQPILFIEREEGKHSDFMVINGNTLYVYDVRAEVLDENKKS